MASHGQSLNVIVNDLIQGDTIICHLHSPLPSHSLNFHLRIEIIFFYLEMKCNESDVIL